MPEYVRTWRIVIDASDPGPTEAEVVRLQHWVDDLHAVVPMDSLTFERVEPGSPLVYRYQFQPVGGGGG